MRIHEAKILSSLSMIGIATVMFAGCSTSPKEITLNDYLSESPSIRKHSDLGRCVVLNATDAPDPSPSEKIENANCHKKFHFLFPPVKLLPGEWFGMMGEGKANSLPRTFDATDAGKTEVEASNKACIDARKVAKTFHSEAGFLNVTKTKKKTNGWTATCEVKEFSTVVDSQNGPAKGPVLDVDFKVCHVGKGTYKEIVAERVATFSGVPVPVGSTTNTAFVSEIQWDGRSTKAVLPSIVTTGFEAVFTPIVDKNGRIRVAFTLDDSNLKEIKTLKNGAQYPVVDKALSKSGTLDLASGETKSVDLGKGFRMTVSAKVTSSPMISQKSNKARRMK
ncbi:MAG: hypothetical protein ACYDBP_04590 [Leptospirales bacterium]